MLPSNTNELVNKIFQSLKNKCDDLNKEMEASGFCFKFVSRLNIRCQKVNAERGSSFTKLSDWLRYKSATINSQSSKDRCFQYALGLTQHHKKNQKWL